MIHNPLNTNNKKYSPVYLSSNSINSSNQNIVKNSSLNFVYNNINNGIDIIKDRLSNLEIININILSSQPIYDEPQSVFSVAETLDPSDFAAEPNSASGLIIF